MELDGKCRHIVVGDALAGAVVDIDKCLLRALRQRIAQYLIAVVLAADVDASGRQILDRPEGQPRGIRAWSARG